MTAKQKPPFDADAFLRSAGAGKTILTYQPADVIFSQGDASDSVLYIQEGAVKLSVLSSGGKEAVVGVLGPGDFFGERALTGHPVRLEAATAMTATTALSVPKEQMIRLLHDQHALSDRFITYMLARNIRIEADLVDQLFNSSEKRLARTLLLVARYGRPDETHHALPRISQETLAEMIGTTRSRVNFFMNKFKKLGFIEYKGDLKGKRCRVRVIPDRAESGTLPVRHAASQTHSDACGRRVDSRNGPVGRRLRSRTGLNGWAAGLSRSRERGARQRPCRCGGEGEGACPIGAADISSEP
jgi:CRP/FNR family cyclic AMP-dependent transcriptional regulator